jgi:hypothetical protein
MESAVNPKIVVPFGECLQNGGFGDDGKELPFRLPAKPDNVYAALFAGMQYEERLRDERMKKAEAIAWRICKTWLEAQITLINLEQAKLEEVFLPCPPR